jgi:hypothetical protein
MPNIPSYDLPAEQSRVVPRSEGATATMRAGRILQETARSVGDMQLQGARQLAAGIAKAGNLVDDYVTQSDISSAAQEHTRITAQASKDLPGLIANSKDPVKAVQDYYDNTYAPAVQKINDNMSTKRGRMWAAEHSQAGAQAFMRTGLAEAATVAGARAIESFNTSVNNLAEAARNDPHNLQSYIDQGNSLIDGMKGTLTPAQQAQVELHRNKVSQQLTISAGHALADQNPTQFMKDLDAGWGKGVLDEQHRDALHHYAQYTQKRQGRIAKGNSTGTVADWINGKYDSESGQDREITPQDIGSIINNPNVLPEDKQSIQRFGVTMNHIQTWMQEHKVKGRGVPQGDAAAELDLRHRLADPNNPTTIDQITDALEQYGRNPNHGVSPAKAMAIAKMIKPTKAMDLKKLMDDPILKGELDRADTIISGNAQGDPKTNPAIKGKIDDFRLETMRTLQDALSRGENIREYLDPKNPKYLFVPERIQQYRPSDKERSSGVLNRPPTVMQNPNDSMFLKGKQKPEVPPQTPGRPEQGRKSIGEFFKGLGGK